MASCIVGKDTMKTCPQCKMRYPNEAVFCFIDGADLVVLKDKRIGTLVAARYQIEEVIGEGGMATVYRATQTLTDRVCAVKIMNATFARETTVRTLSQTIMATPRNCWLSSMSLRAKRTPCVISSRQFWQRRCCDESGAARQPVSPHQRRP